MLLAELPSLLLLGCFLPTEAATAIGVVVNEVWVPSSTPCPRCPLWYGNHRSRLLEGNERVGQDHETRSSTKHCCRVNRPKLAAANPAENLLRPDTGTARNLA